MKLKSIEKLIKSLGLNLASDENEHFKIVQIGKKVLRVSVNDHAEAVAYCQYDTYINEYGNHCEVGFYAKKVKEIEAFLTKPYVGYL